MEKIKYSVVIPVYNSGSWLEKLVEDICVVLDESREYEIVLVNDRSPNKNTWTVIKEICDKNKRVRGIDLQYNAGQFNALLCGIKHSKGSYVITMDDDFQHSPSEIPKLIQKIQDKDCDCVIGSYAHKEHHFIRVFGSGLVNHLMERIYRKPRDVQSTSFRIMKREFAQVLISYVGKNPQVGPMVFLADGDVENVLVEHHKREYGKSGYRPLRLVTETLNVIINSSTFPLDVVTLGGFGVAGLSFLIGIVYFILYITGKIKVPGFTAQILVTTFFSGVILLSIGVVGKYVGHIVKELIGFPAYMVKEIYEQERKEKGDG